MRKNIYLIGPMAAGKSTIGKKLAKSLGYDWIDTDRAIVDRTGVDIVWIFDQEGEAGFRKRERDLVHELSEQAQMLVSTGAGTILDEANRQVMKNTGVVIYLKVSIEKQVQRTEKDRIRPLLQTDDKDQKLRELAEQRNALYESIADIQIETDSSSVDKIVSGLKKDLSNYLGE